GSTLLYHHLPPASQKAINLLVFGRTLVESLVKVGRQQRAPRFFPMAVIRPGQFDARHPVPGNRPKTSGSSSPPVLIWPFRIFNVWRKRSDNMILLGCKANANRIPRFPPMPFRVLILLIRSAIRPLISNRLLGERLWAG